jgi:MraZ protein
MFRGSSPARVDEKGRLKVPADFKRVVDEKYGPKFYITSKDGKRAEVYPLQEWEKIEERLAKIPSMNQAKQKFLDITSYYGQMAEMDAQGRLLLPQLLRETAKVTEDVVVFGKMAYLEVANHEGFKAQMTPLSNEELMELSELGL